MPLTEIPVYLLELVRTTDPAALVETLGGGDAERVGDVAGRVSGLLANWVADENFWSTLSEESPPSAAQVLENLSDDEILSRT